MYEGRFLWVEAKEKLFSQCDALDARWCKCVNPQTCGPVVITSKRATAVKTAVASWLLITLRRRRPSTEAQVLLVNNFGGRARKRTAERELENLSRISFFKPSSSVPRAGILGRPRKSLTSEEWICKHCTNVEGGEKKKRLLSPRFKSGATVQPNNLNCRQPVIIYSLALISGRPGCGCGFAGAAWRQPPAYNQGIDVRCQCRPALFVSRRLTHARTHTHNARKRASVRCERGRASSVVGLGWCGKKKKKKSQKLLVCLRFRSGACR